MADLSDIPIRGLFFVGKLSSTHALTQISEKTDFNSIAVVHLHEYIIIFSCKQMSILIILFSNSFIRKLRFDKLDKIFHDLEVVPLFGDMQIAPFNYVKTSKHYDSAKWPMSAAAAGCYTFHFTNFF